MGSFRFLRRQPGATALAICLAMTCLFGGEPQASAQSASAAGPTQSASAAAPAQTAPATAPAADARKIETILQALKLSDAQAGAYQVALSRKGQIDDPVTLTMFLRKIASLPMLQSEEWNDLDRPAARSLLAEPQRYAGRPIRLRALVNVVWKWTPGADFAATADWTRNDKPIYRYDCLNADAQYPASEPLYVLSPVEPNVFLGRPTGTGKDGQGIYGSFPPVQLAGVFYKVYATKDTTGQARDYPVVLAWQIRPAEGGGLATSPDSWQQAVVALGIALAIGILIYFYWRFRQAAKRARSRASFPRGPPQPPRQQEEKDEAQEPSPEEDQADPSLAAAAAEFRKQKQDEDP